MEYKVVIENDGSITTDVLNRGKHKCNDILNVTQSFGKTIESTDKPDNQPVNINVGN